MGQRDSLARIGKSVSRHDCMFDYDLSNIQLSVIIIVIDNDYISPVGERVIFIFPNCENSIVFLESIEERIVLQSQRLLEIR